MQRAAFKVALSAIAVAAAFASTAHAAGFMLTEQSAGALGRAYAGAGVDGTDLSGVYYNPATMVLHKGTAIQMGFVGIGLNLDYVGEKDGQEVTANGRNKSQAIPHGYIVHQINDKVWFGLGMTVPFGMGTEYDDDWAESEHGISATIRDSVFLGLNTHYFVTLSTGEEAEIIQESSIDSIIEPGTRIRLTVNTEKVNIFSEDGSANLLAGVVNDNAMEA